MGEIIDKVRKFIYFMLMIKEEALKLCKRMHAKQKYIVDGKEVPYYNHCIMVANIIGENAEKDLDIEFAQTVALLHDTLEDTPLTLEYLKEHFGDKVAAGVLALTKNQELKYEDRLGDSLSRINALKSKEVAAVKLADRICNLYETPAGWSKEKEREYIADATKIVDRLGWASQKLAAKLKEMIRKREKEL